MESFEVFQEVFSKCSPKNLTDELGLKEPSIYKWTAQAERRLNPLDRIVAIIRLSKNLLPLHWLCERFGGYFVHNPEVTDSKPLPLSAAGNRVVHRFARMIASISHAAAVNKISNKETKDFRAEWEDLKSLMEGFVCGCERGDFNACHAQMNSAPPANNPRRI